MQKTAKPGTGALKVPAQSRELLAASALVSGVWEEQPTQSTKAPLSTFLEKLQMQRLTILGSRH